MSTQAIMDLSREFDTIVDMVSNATDEKVTRQVKIIKNEIAELREGVVRYDYDEIRDGCMDVIKTVMGMMILTDQEPKFTEPPLFVVSYEGIVREALLRLVDKIEESVDNMYGAWLDEIRIPSGSVAHARMLMGKNTLSNLCESALHHVYLVCEQYGIDVLGDYKLMHEGLMSRFDTSEENAKATAEHYAKTYGEHVELYHTLAQTPTQTLYVNRLKAPALIKGQNEPANKMMKSVFFKEPDYSRSKSIQPKAMRQLRSIMRAELERMVEGKVQYKRVGGSTKTIATCEVVPGFVLVGTSATLCPRIFDEKMGEEVARDEIIEQLWQLEGYARQRMRQLDICPESFYDHGA